MTRKTPWLSQQSVWLRSFRLFSGFRLLSKWGVSGYQNLSFWQQTVSSASQTPSLQQFELFRDPLNVTTIDLKPIECDNSWVETTWMWQKLIWQLLMESNNLLCIHLKDPHCYNTRFELTLKQLVRVDFYNHLLLILLILSLWQKYVLALRSNLFQLFVTKVSALVLNCQIW